MKSYSATVVAALALALLSNGAEAACINSAGCPSLQYCRKADATCVPKLLAGSSCTYDISCASLTCSLGKCTLQPNGIRCTASTQCVSGNCASSMCAAKLELGGACTKAVNCISGYCNTATSKCAAAPGAPSPTAATSTSIRSTSLPTSTIPAPPGSPTPTGAAKFFPKGKAGLSGGQAMKYLAPYLGWWNDWTPNPVNRYAVGGPDGVSMLWGLGRLNHDNDISRFNLYTNASFANSFKYQASFNEFDFSGGGSSGKMLLNESVAAWERYIAPKRASIGAKLISPSCAMGRFETLCGQFINNVTTKVDAISVHIFRPNLPEVSRALNYWRKYNLPLVITELACIDYEIKPAYFCNQTEINAWWPAVIDLMENDPAVAGYAFSDAANGVAAQLTNYTDGTISQTGQVILNKLKSRAMAKRSMRYPIPRGFAEFDLTDA